jgi:hypothetical protein
MQHLTVSKRMAEDANKGHAICYALMYTEHCNRVLMATDALQNVQFPWRFVIR